MSISPVAYCPLDIKIMLPSKYNPKLSNSNLLFYVWNKKQAFAGFAYCQEIWFLPSWFILSQFSSNKIAVVCLELWARLLFVI